MVARGLQRAAASTPIHHSPGEFEFPVGLLAPGDDRLWVVDAGRAIHRYQLQTGRPAYVDRLELAGFSRDACTLGDSVIVHAPAHVPGAMRGEVLFRFDLNGNLGIRFAAPYRYRHRLVANRLKRGAITCGRGLVFLAFDAQNRLDAYRARDGRLVWHATFESVLIPPVIERMRSDGRRAISSAIREERRFHSLLGAAGGQGSPVIIQFARYDTERVLQGVQDYEVETYLVEPETGRGVFYQGRLPRVLAIEGSLIAFLHLDPYPKIEVARLAGPDGLSISSAD